MELLIITLILYFIPSLIGLRKRNAAAIFALNLFLGWTLIGWVIALVWAITMDAPTPVVAQPVSASVPEPAPPQDDDPFISDLIAEKFKNLPVGRILGAFIGIVLLVSILSSGGKEQEAGKVTQPSSTTVGRYVPPAVRDEEGETQRAQVLLNFLGYNAGPADGVAGKKTRAAVSKFQREHGLNANGRVSAELLRALTAARDARRGQG